MGTVSWSVTIFATGNNISAHLTAILFEYDPTAINALSAHILRDTGNTILKIGTATKAMTVVAAEKKYITGAEHTVRVVITH